MNNQEEGNRDKEKIGETREIEWIRKATLGKDKEDRGKKEEGEKKKNFF